MDPLTTFLFKSADAGWAAEFLNGVLDLYEVIVSCDGAVAAALAAAHGQPFGGAETREAFVTAETVQNALVIHFMLNLVGISAHSTSNDSILFHQAFDPGLVNAQTGQATELLQGVCRVNWNCDQVFWIPDHLETEVAGFLWGNIGGWRQGESSQTYSGAEQLIGTLLLKCSLTFLKDLRAA